MLMLDELWIKGALGKGLEEQKQRSRTPGNPEVLADNVKMRADWCSRLAVFTLSVQWTRRTMNTTIRDAVTDTAVHSAHACSNPSAA